MCLREKEMRRKYNTIWVHAIGDLRLKDFFCGTIYTALGVRRTLFGAYFAPEAGRLFSLCDGPNDIWYGMRE